MLFLSVEAFFFVFPPEVFGGDLAHKMFIGEILSFQGDVVNRALEVDGEFVLRENYPEPFKLVA